jgi:acyl carrier protein
MLVNGRSVYRKLAELSAQRRLTKQPVRGRPMATSEITDRVRKILALHLGVEESRISLHTTLADLGVDSLDRVEIAMSIEEAFNISIPDWAADKFVTVGDATSFVDARFHPSGGA